jgi:hypothetical protein
VTRCKELLGIKNVSGKVLQKVAHPIELMIRGYRLGTSQSECHFKAEAAMLTPDGIFVVVQVTVPIGDKVKVVNITAVAFVSTDSVQWVWPAEAIWYRGSPMAWVHISINRL